MSEYTATSLEDIAYAFDVFASDQIACQRFQTTQKGKRECKIRAEIWKDAAEILRQTKLVLS